MGSVPGQAELLSENAHTRVFRLRLPDGHSVLRKEPLGPDAEERAGHEASILRRLSGVANIVQLAPDQPDAKAIMLEDIPGVLLARIATPLEPARMVGLMLDLARVVAAMHEHGVVHRDISPPNILVAEDGPYLIDFALATTFTELRPEFTHPQEIVGTLPYLAPEQTGRTGRSMDRRADLYGLGATMYELATGDPPFGTGDPLRLIHDHLARAATPPAEVNPALPPGLSEIIMHLLEKEPDNRYQTAEGLRHDLQRVRDGAQHLRVGAGDVPPRMTEPPRLIGRGHEIDVLRAALEGVRAGQSRGVVISGESCVGKSALIDELRPMVADVDGWFTSGRFDGYHRDAEHDGSRRRFAASPGSCSPSPSERIEVVMLIAGQLAVSLENALLYSSLERKVAERTEQLAHANERLAQLSVTDPLTGLANRRRLEDSLSGEWQRVQRTRAPLSLAMVDIDHFKQYNDRHGHVEGDRCLQRVAAQIGRNVRGSDLVARYGGEEFAIVMPHTDSAAATEAAERVRLAISALAESLTDDQVVTASVGVATMLDADGQSTDRLVELADAALYDAKRSGRNRVCSARSR